MAEISELESKMIVIILILIKFVLLSGADSDYSLKASRYFFHPKIINNFIGKKRKEINKNKLLTNAVTHNVPPMVWKGGKEQS